MKYYKINLHSKLSNLSKLRSAVREIFAIEKLSNDSLCKDLLLVLTELFVNFVEHGNGKAETTINIFIAVSMEKIDFVIHDNGNSYEPFIEKPDISRLPERGFGLFIINSLMDTYQYLPKNSKRDYNVTKLAKFL